MTSKQRTWGQFATPIDLADLLLGFCLRHPDGRLLDPSCGDGALLRRAIQWRSWLASSSAAPMGAIYGVELDPDAAAVAANIPGAVIDHANFFTLDPGVYPTFDAIIGNPPYTRAEWIDRLDAGAGQLILFPDEASNGEEIAPAPILSRELGAALGGRSSLYAYFFLHSFGFLREGGRLGFVVPNGWLDVAYGAALKQFLLDHFRVVAVIESAVERWFAAARVNTCVIILERAGDPAARAANRVRFIRLRQSLGQLLDAESDSRRVSAVEQLVTRLLPAADRQTPSTSIRVREQATLTAGERWGALLRAPEVYLRRPSRPVAPLGDWATARRGATTGANSFFYLDRKRVEAWRIEPQFRRPLLKSLRRVHSLRVGAEDCDHELLSIPPEARIEGTAAAQYLAWGESQGFAARTSCAARRPWYALPEQPAGSLFVAKGVWQRHFVAVAEEPIAIDQQIYRIALSDGISPDAAAALLNSAWFALRCELGGRVNLGEGVLWLASYELSQLSLPDPRLLDDGERHALEECFRRLARQPVGDTPDELERVERRALDELVFDLVGLTVAEREAARAALIECLAGRRLRARQIAVGGA